VVRRTPAAAVLAVAAIAAAVLGVALEAGWWSGSETATPRAAISAQVSLSPGAVHFGDPLTARAMVVLDPARVKTSSVRFAPRFGSYRIARGSRDTRREGGLTRVSYSFVLECLGAGCAPGQPQVALRFPQAILRFRTRTGNPSRLAVQWPSITVASRLDDSDRADPAAHLRADTSPPPVSYRLSPGVLVAGLATVSGLLVLAAGVLVFLALPRTAPARTEPQADGTARSPLADALRLVRETAADGHGPEQRRMALQRLVRELRRSDRRELALTAGRLAWSNGPPSAGAAREFAAQVERELSGQR
jgi:hypothetical protein